MKAPRFLSAAVHKELSNKSLQSGEVPQDWRQAIICPIFNKGDPKDADNYRPMSLTSALCKIFKILLKKALLLFLTEIRSLSQSHHGFLPRRSCLSKLILQEERVTRLVDEGHTVDLVYLDFAKAFDSINHRFLLAKLKSSGIDGAVLNWIKSNLANRSFQVRFGGILF